MKQKEDKFIQGGKNTLNPLDPPYFQTLHLPHFLFVLNDISSYGCTI